MNRRLLPDLFHITEVATWQMAANDKVFDTLSPGASRAEVGFIHASFAWQIERVANLIYASNDEPLLLLRVDPDRLDVPVRVETMDDYPEPFPHIYGPIPVEAVVEVLAFERSEGKYELPFPLDYQ